MSSVDTTSKTLEFKAGLVTCAGIGSGGKRIVYKLLLQTQIFEVLNGRDVALWQNKVPGVKLLVVFTEFYTFLQM